MGAISVPGVNGAWGVLALGLFAERTYGDGVNGVYGPVRGLFYGDAGQLVAELIGISTNILYVGCAGWLALSAIGKLVGNRVSAADEQRGLDLAELRLEGYPPQDERVLEPPLPARGSLDSSAMALRYPAEGAGPSGVLAHAGNATETPGPSNRWKWLEITYPRETRKKQGAGSFAVSVEVVR